MRYHVTVEIRKKPAGARVTTYPVRETMMLDSWAEVAALAFRAHDDTRGFHIVETCIVHEPTPGSAENALKLIDIIRG